MASTLKNVNVLGFVFLLCVSLCAVPFAVESTSKWTENEEIQIFREYLRIPTVHPNVDYKPAVAFLKRQAATLGLPVKVIYPVNRENPVVVMTWAGSEPELPSIMLNSHLDVVPVYEEYWTHPPFAAEIDENGDIFGRGSQDTKAIGMQYLAAIRALKRRGMNQLKRTIHITFVPEEELGGMHGMQPFIRSEEFKAMNVVFALDESGARPDRILPAYYVERTIWQVEFIFHGQSGHGSMLFENTPGEKLNYVVNKLMEYRRGELRKMKESNLPYGNVTSINLTMLKGGVETNVIPAELSATFDMRVATLDLDKLEQKINRWCEEAGGNITMITLARGIKEIPTRIDDSNPFWIALKHGVEESGLEVVPTIFPAATDIRFLRQVRIFDDFKAN